MATSFSENQLNIAKKIYYGRLYFTRHKPNFFMVIVNKLLIYLLYFRVSIINLKRFILRNLIQFFIKKNNGDINISLSVKDSDLENYSKKLQENNYAFIENFIDNKSYNQILKNWPDINFFKHQNKIIKYYSIGFRCINGKYSKSDLTKISKYKELKEYYNFIRSANFNKFVNKLLKFENSDFYNYAIKSSMAGNNSYLVPHIDGVTNTMKTAYNFIYFADGNDDNLVFSGATGIYEDNNFQKPIFIPTTLKNSLLVYKSTEKFYHGFQFMKLPKDFYRKTVNFEFYPK